MANYVYIATSLDGFIAASDGGVDWLQQVPNPEQSDYGFAEFMEKIDALVMGSHTYETVVSFGVWPYDKPVFVLSNRLKSVDPAHSGKAEIIAGEPGQIVKQLHERGYKNLYVDGGVVIQSFLKAGLIDAMIITRVPVLLGSGVRLFGELAEPLWFQHCKTEVLSGQLVKTYYKRSL